MARRSIIARTGHTAGRSSPARPEPRGRASGRLSDGFTGEDPESRCREAIRLAEHRGVFFRGHRLDRARKLWAEGITQGHEPGPVWSEKAARYGLDQPTRFAPQRTAAERQLMNTPGVDVDWDDLAAAVAWRNPKGAAHADYYREMGRLQRATGNPGPAPGEAGAGL